MNFITAWNLTGIIETWCKLQIETPKTTDTQKEAEIPWEDLRDNLVCANWIIKPLRAKKTSRKSLYSMVALIKTIRCTWLS